MSRKIKKIAIANRGEVAVRLISTCLEMGITPVLLYSEADKNSLPYRLCPEKILIGPSEPHKSYLNAPAIIEGALKAGVQALHPGYGFLSEKAELAQACLKNNLIFIGPPASALDILGDKVRAREQAVKCGLPVLPAYNLSQGKKTPAIAQLLKEPVIIKATKGGGGCGLKVVHSEKEWEESWQSAQRSAQAGFGSSELFVEKFLPLARHIEVQIFVSAKGEAFYLFDRDCSLQRKHQKIIESAPADLPPSIKKEMAEAGLALLKSVHYRQAGTVEFLYHNRKFYFMEVNPRIQVECPVTEMILGVDLIKAQILTAEGKEPFFSKTLKPKGHSLQCRIYAEDMGRQIPVFGQLMECYFPHGVGRRFDIGYETGDHVPSFYDSMLCKLIVHGENRENARQKMKQALNETVLFGLKTNVSFLRDLISHKSFIQNKLHTRFVEEEFLKTWKSADVQDLNLELISSLRSAFKSSKSTINKEQAFNPWTGFTEEKV